MTCAAGVERIGAPTRADWCGKRGLRAGEMGRLGASQRRAWMQPGP